MIELEIIQKVPINYTFFIVVPCHINLRYNTKEVDYIEYLRRIYRLKSQKLNEDGTISEVPFKVSKIVPSKNDGNELFLKWDENKPNILTVTKENNSTHSIIINFVTIEQAESGNKLWFEVALLAKEQVQEK